jgi:glycosyltransferase involved in cell wall biosynthesis
MSVVFYDDVCPKPYSFDTLRYEPLGGTEATVIRVAEALAAHTEVTVLQHNRTAKTYSGAKYLPLDSQANPTHVIALRTVSALKAAVARFPNAKPYLWLHDLASQDLVINSPTLQAIKPTIVCVSNFHVLNVKDKFTQTPDLRGITVKRIYNPIDENLIQDATPVDRNKLVFFSSPHKGLEYTLKLFTYIRNVEPEMQLFVANPGYAQATGYQSIPGVVDLGPLPHSEIIKHVRSALCTFYPNRVFPETFGLVMAESDAVGTPVLTHSFGAAPEVLYHPCEHMDVTLYQAVVDKVIAWRNGLRPRVKANPEFRLSAVIRAWARLFGI